MTKSELKSAKIALEAGPTGPPSDLTASRPTPNSGNRFGNGQRAASRPLHQDFASTRRKRVPLSSLQQQEQRRKRDKIHGQGRPPRPRQPRPPQTTSTTSRPASNSGNLSFAPIRRRAEIREQRFPRPRTSLTTPHGPHRPQTTSEAASQPVPPLQSRFGDRQRAAPCISIIVFCFAETDKCS